MNTRSQQRLALILSDTFAAQEGIIQAQDIENNPGLPITTGTQQLAAIKKARRALRSAQFNLQLAEEEVREQIADSKNGLLKWQQDNTTEPIVPPSQIGKSKTSTTTRRTAAKGSSSGTKTPTDTKNPSS